MPQPQLPDLEYWEVPRCWSGETVAVLGGGFSLTQRQVDHLRGKCRVIAINRAGLPRPAKVKGDWVGAPWADWLWACDPHQFWAWHPEAVVFAGVKIVLRGCHYLPRDRWRKLAELQKAGVRVLRHTSREYPVTPRHEGASPDPGVVRGDNGAFQVLSVIHHTGVSTVLLLGVDMGGRHWHEGYGMGQPDYAGMVGRFRSLKRPLAEAGVAVLNCSAGSALDAWPKVKLEDVL